MDVLSKFKLEDKVAIVTGAGAGIGKAIALHFAHVGAHIVVAELDPKTGEATSKEVRALGRKSLAMAVDVTKPDQVNKLVDAVMKEFKRIDILVNNAGGNNPMAPAIKIGFEDWEKYIRLNLTSAFVCTKAVAPVMIKQKKGNIVSLASAAGTRANPGLSPYAAAKAGVINFTETLSIELAPYHIRVNCIVPGAIETALGAGVRGSAQERVARAGIPLGRVGQPEDVALAALFLASDASDYVTGTHIDVKGGPYTRKGDTEMFVAKFPNLGV